MQYISTRGEDPPLDFAEAAQVGMARDGGLLIPETIPDVSGRIESWQKLSYTALACELMELFGNLPSDEWSMLIKQSYSTFRHPDITPVVRVGPVYILELFHGPSLSFKDIALQFLGCFLENILARSDGVLNVVAATSGDTGSAAIHGLRGKSRLRVFVLYPRGRISPVQERQMTSVVDDNVYILSLDGTFDDCQRIAKSLFSDLAFRDRVRLGSVNSINWARLLPQIVYYFYATFRVQEATGAARVRVAVPTGNFGNIFAGYLARRMGLPISRLVLATNENDVLTRFFRTGIYRPAPARPTLSPSMDIQRASNLERYLYYRVGKRADRVRSLIAELHARGEFQIETFGPEGVDALFCAGAADTDQTLETIRWCYDAFGYLLDPHTAVGVSVARAHLDPSEPMICLATAHPAKFGEAIRRATGKNVAHHSAVDALQGLATRRVLLPASVSAVRTYVEGIGEGGR